MKEKILIIFLAICLVSSTTAIVTAKSKSIEKQSNLSGCHIERNCFIYGSIEGPFKCLRLPGLFYILESEEGGELFIDCGDCSIHEKGCCFKITIVGFFGLFIGPLHNGKNIIDRQFFGYASLVSYEIE